MNAHDCPICKATMFHQDDNDLIQECSSCTIRWYAKESLKDEVSSKRKILHYIKGGASNYLTKTEFNCPECNNKLFEVNKPDIFDFELFYCENGDGFLLNNDDLPKLKKLVEKSSYVSVRQTEIKRNLSSEILAQKYKEKINNPVDDEKEESNFKFEEASLEDLPPLQRFFALLSFPIKLTSKKSKDHFAIFVLIIISVNVVVYISLNLMSENPQDLLEKYAFQPIRFQKHKLKYFYTLITSFFLHADFSHILGNMYFLSIFGRDVEKKLNSIFFFIVFMMGGIFCNWMGAVFNISPDNFHLGASGAISVISGIFIVFFPKEKFFTFSFIVPSYFYLGLWFLLQIIFQITSSGQGVNFFAHAIGFVLGLLTASIAKSFCGDSGHSLQT